MDSTFKPLTDGDFADLSRIALLITAYINGQLSNDQIRELEIWVNENEYNRSLFADFTNPEYINRLRMEKYN